MKRLHSIAVLIAVLAVSVPAQTESATGNRTVLSSEELTISMSDDRTFEFDIKRQKDTDVVVTIEARIEIEKLSGTGRILKLSLNGQPLLAAKDRRTLRLLNKSVNFRYGGNFYQWTRGEGLWDVIYAPDYEVGQRVGLGGDQAYFYTFEVSDLVTAKDNILKIANVPKKGNRPNSSVPVTPVILKKVTVHRGEKPS